MAIDATPAGAASDSYLTVAAADTLAAADLGRFATGWSAATTDQKERALKRATRDIDAVAGYVGDRYSTLQALLFPRSEDVNTAGSPIIPRGVERACYEQAIFILDVSTVVDDAAARRARGITSGAEPDVSYQLADDPMAGQLSPRAWQYLRPETSRSTIGWIATT